MSIEDRFRILLIRLIKNLANKNYEQIIIDKQNGRLSEEDIIQSIYKYSEDWNIEALITMPPKNEFDKLDLIKITHSPEYVLHFDLWINGEKSDLTLICEIEVDQLDNIIRFEIDDIHVM
ncbi:MAG: hypothetical protein K0R54_1598 [Clostridiaceae bacterium]|nr:hypothetical protein [Clostridiaceae bacterium]